MQSDQKVTGESSSIFELCKNKIFLILILTGSGILIIQNYQQSFAVQYSNFSSDKYGVQFQYPTDWEAKERANRFEKGTDIKASSPSLDGLFTIQPINQSEFLGKDLKSLVYEYYKSSIGDYTNEIRPIEQPTFMTIDNQQAGTYLYTFKERYPEDSLTWAVQYWLIKPSDSGYLFQFAAPSDRFDSPLTTEIRDHFIKSVKFLNTNTIPSNQTSRFD